MAGVEATYEEHLKCPVCYETYNTPKTLPCLHNFCKGCLNSIILSLDEKGDLEEGIACPVCHAVADVPSMALNYPQNIASMFPTNHLIVSLLNESMEKNGKVGRIVFGQNQMGRKKRKNFNTLEERMEYLKERCIEIMEMERVNQDKLLQQRQSVQGSIRDFRQKIVELLNNMEDEVEERLTQVIEKEKQRSSQLLRNCLRTVDVINKLMQSHHAEVQKAKSKGQLPKIRLNESVLPNEDLDKTVDQLHKSCKKGNLEFIVDQKLVEVLNSVNKFGDVRISFGESLPSIVTPSSSKPSSKLTRRSSKTLSLSSQTTESLKISENQSIRGLIVMKARQLEPRLTSDNIPCLIVGSLFLPDGRLVLIDKNNPSLRLYDKTFTYLSRVRLPAPPRDLTCTGPTELVVLMDKKIINFFTIDADGFKSTRIIHKDEQYNGIACLRDELVVTLGSGRNAGVKILDMDGYCKKTIQPTDGKGNFALWNTRYVAASPTHSLIMISDANKGLVCIDTHGRMQFAHNMILTCGMTSDNIGNFYGFCSQNFLNEFTPDGSRLRIAIPTEKQTYHESLSICLNSEKTILCLTSKYGVEIFSLFGRENELPLIHS
ncbi:hypothetical protein ACJMK2_039337 [Sinanodonta woodiana]|uniref:RING-type domain-containing protein n=1 Tax=Sinanodonta woodiana TaxID=1069815 RepID=A0ABD3WFM5_SINWO